MCGFFLYADLGDALVDEIHLSRGPVRGGLTSWVVLCSFDAAEAPFVLVFLDGLLGGPVVSGPPVCGGWLLLFRSPGSFFYHFDFSCT